MSDDEKLERRGALKALAAVTGVAVCGAVAAPSVAVLVAPAARSGASGKWVRTVKLDMLADGFPRKVSVRADARDAYTVEKDKELGAVWLIRHGEAVECFSAACPHLGCSVGRAEGGAFFCPCHDSTFAKDGAREKGPSPRGLDLLATKVEDGWVLVDFRRFRLGIPERIEIG